MTYVRAGSGKAPSSTHPIVHMHLLAATCEAVAGTSSKTEKIRLVGEYLSSRPVPEAAIAAVFLSGRAFAAYEERTLQVGGTLLWKLLGKETGLDEGELSAVYRRHGDLGAAAFEVLQATASRTSTLSLTEVARTLAEISNSRSSEARTRLVTALLCRATALEAKYLIKIITGELRIGLKENLVEEAIAKAYGSPVVAVQRANMLTGDIGETLVLAAAGKLDEARMRLFHPIGFMLATPAATAEEAFAEFQHALVEEKYDGIRAQAHISGGKVRLFSRTLDDITASFPDLGPSLEAFGHEAILDGEILGWRHGQSMAFSELQKRLGRKRIPEFLLEEIPVSYLVFDVLYARGELQMDRPLRERAVLLDELFAEAGPRLAAAPEYGQGVLGFGGADSVAERRMIRAPQTRAESPDALDRLFEEAQARGNEGLMIKNPESAYAGGRRGRSWLKLKRELATLDVVVTAVEFGHGRRAGVLSDYTFAVSDGGQLLNIGKAYSGLTDKEIAHMTQWFLEHTVADHGFVREVEPKIVLEVAFNAVMRSDRHASGFALRFPRILRIRDDKPVSEIDTLERVEHIYASQFHQRIALK